MSGRLSATRATTGAPTSSGSSSERAAAARRELERWLWTTVEQQVEALAVLRVDIKEARATLARIEDTTWGLELTEIDGERFMVLPAGILDNPPWTVGGRPALKLSGE